MSVTPSPIGGFAAQFFDNNGVILSGGKIYTYAAGTTTPQASYTSASGVTPHANPIILDSAGRVPGGEIWLTDGLVYKFVIETAASILIGTYDNITGVNSNFVNYTVQEEVITATAGQTVFDLSTINYTPGTNSLTVYIDGVNQYVGDSYLETDSDTVTFTSGVHVGGEVKFTTAVQTTTGAVDASIVSYEPPFANSVATNVEAKLAQYVSVKDFGAVGDGVTDDTAAIQAALDSGAEGVYIPGGTYKITASLVVDGNTGTTATHIYGDGGFSSQLAWSGSLGGTMLVVGKDPRQMTRFEGIYFNANQLATKIAHIGISTTTAAVVRNMTFEQCIFTEAQTGTAIWLGDYTASPAIAEADIANFNIVRCQFFNNNHSVTWDSVQALEVNIDGCFMSRSGSGIFIDEALYMERGGSASVINSYFGGISNGGSHNAIYVKDGWVNIKNSEFEYGIGGAGDGVLHLDTPALSSTTTGTPSSLMNCRISGPGFAGTGNYVLVSSSNHPLTILGCSFQGKTGGALVTYALNNAGSSRVVSINNKYLGYFWNGSSQVNVSSFGDTYNDGSTAKFMPVNLGRQRDITSASSPYAVAFDDDTIVSSSGACTINLPTIGLPHTGGGQHRRLTVKRTSASGTTSIVAAGGNTIDGLSQVDLVQNQNSTIVLESDGFSKWLIVSFYSPGNQAAASTGVGSVKMGNANSADNAGWLEITPGKYVPYWTDATP